MTLATLTMPWQQLRARTRQRWQKWADQRHAESASTTLGQRNIYILPTRSGLFFALLLLTLLIGAINYQLNLGYLLTFMLAGVGVMSMHMTHRNLRALTLALQPLESAHAGSVTSMRLVLTAQEQVRYSIALWCEGDDRAHATTVNVMPGTAAPVTLAMPLKRRGWQQASRISLETRFPLGLWRAWSHWQPRGREAQVLVYPALEHPALSIPYWLDHASNDEDNKAQYKVHTGEYDGVRPYRAGDEKKRVVWKKYAKADELVARDDLSAASNRLVLDFQALGGLDTEQRLQRLASWVVACQKQDQPFELRLPDERLPLGSGAAHAQAALRLLALHGLPQEAA